MVTKIKNLKEDNDMQEEWKPIEGCEGIFEISSVGKVISKSRTVVRTNHNGTHSVKVKCKTLIPHKNRLGYYFIRLWYNSKFHTHYIHELVWRHFGDGRRNNKDMHIDHINNNKADNKIDNLQLITRRENIVKATKLWDKSSKYTGVSWCKRDKKWAAYIYINKKHEYLGRFNNEEDAAMAYEKALNTILKTA